MLRDETIMNTIQLLYPSCLSSFAMRLAKELEEQHYKVIHNPDVFLEAHLGIAIFEAEMEEEAYLKEMPLLKEQLEYSSIKHLRILPLFVYDGRRLDPEECFEGATGEFVESIFSGEFKPYGYDVSRDNNIKELLSIIEENYEE